MPDVIPAAIPKRRTCKGLPGRRHGGPVNLSLTLGPYEVAVPLVHAIVGVRAPRRPRRQRPGRRIVRWTPAIASMCQDMVVEPCQHETTPRVQLAAGKLGSGPRRHARILAGERPGAGKRPDAPTANGSAPVNDARARPQAGDGRGTGIRRDCEHAREDRIGSRPAMKRTRTPTK
jgi:hypothetical protein